MRHPHGGRNRKCNGAKIRRIVFERDTGITYVTESSCEKNLALIDETEVDFGPGLNILTGETGAGKSILMGSVGLALGGRYSADMLRNGASSGLVELTFTVEDGRIRDKLKSLDIVPEDDMITLSRRLMEGRSVSRINGENVSMGTLREAASLLIDIHGQHDNQTLLNRKNHLALLDLFAGKGDKPGKRTHDRSLSYISGGQQAVGRGIA